jgi:hypothetical protein
VTGQPITSGVRAALDVARRSLIDPDASPFGPATAVVLALDAAGLLQSPASAAELDTLRRERTALTEVLAGANEERALLQARVAELAPYEALYPQHCEAGQHLSWFADSDGRTLPCPWCELARVQETARQDYRLTYEDAEVATYSSADVAGAHAEGELRAQIPDAKCEWIARPRVVGVLDLVTHHYGHTSATGWAMTTVPVLDEYTPSAAAVIA